MYLSDLLDILNKGEKPNLSKVELLSIFQKDKPLSDTERLDLFHRLGLRYDNGRRLKQREVAHLTGVTRELVAQYDTRRVGTSLFR